MHRSSPLELKFCWLTFQLPSYIQIRQGQKPHGSLLRLHGSLPTGNFLLMKLGREMVVSIGCDSLGQPIGTRGFSISISLLIWGSYLEPQNLQNHRVDVMPETC